jgi:hypothetical protein
MKNKIKQIIANKRNLVIIYILFAMIASIQSLVSGKKTFNPDSIEYTKYNNYIIFKNSFHHLKQNQDLYILYPNEHWDLFKYTPTFSVFFGLIAVFPDWIGLNLWNLINALFLLFSIYYLPKLDDVKKGTILIIALIELMTSIQNSQSNGLIAGLLVLAFGLLENRRYLLATLCIVFSFYIKLFGIVGLVLLLFYPKKWQLGLYTFLWTLLLAAIPLVYIDMNQYASLFQSYMLMLSNDHSTSYGYSVIGWLHSWFHLDFNKNAIVISGAVVLLVPFSLMAKYTNYTFRFLSLTSVLIWIVIFNHKAESPTFIIAMTGIALWFAISQKNAINVALFSLAMLLTSLSPTDVFPKFLRDEYVLPYSLKALPCIFIWFKIIKDMMILKNDWITEEYETQLRDRPVLFTKQDFR